MNKSRYLNDWLTTGSVVTLNQIKKGDSVLFKHFGKGFEPGVDAFEGVEHTTAENGLPLLTDAMGSLEGSVLSKMDAADHVIYLVSVTAAVANAEKSELEPFVHIRKNGFNY